jgi:hypothetical protein
MIDAAGDGPQENDVSLPPRCRQVCRRDGRRALGDELATAIPDVDVSELGTALAGYNGDLDAGERRGKVHLRASGREEGGAQAEVPRQHGGISSSAAQAPSGQRPVHDQPSSPTAWPMTRNWGGPPGGPAGISAEVRNRRGRAGALRTGRRRHRRPEAG